MSMQCSMYGRVEMILHNFGWSVGIMSVPSVAFINL
jgi:hypothetical protein